MLRKRGLACLGLAVLTLLSGCHILSKTEQCADMSRTMKDFEDRISPALPESPTPQALRHKGKLYEELAQALSQLPASDGAVDEKRKEVVAKLRALRVRLEEAAAAVEEAEKDTKKREELAALARERRQKREEERKKTAREHSSHGKTEGKGITAGGNGVPANEKGIAGDENHTKGDENSKKSHQNDAKFDGNSSQSKENGTKAHKKGDEAKPAPVSRVLRLKYDRARKSIQDEARRLELALEGLSEACR